MHRRSHVALINEPCRTHQRVMSHSPMSHVAPIDESCRTHERVRSQHELVGLSHNEEHERTPASKRLVLQALPRLVVILLEQEALLLIRCSNGVDEIGAQSVVCVGCGAGGVCVSVCVSVQGRKREIVDIDPHLAAPIIFLRAVDNISPAPGRCGRERPVCVCA